MERDELGAGMLVATLLFVAGVFGLVLGSDAGKSRERERICIEAKAKGYQLEQCEGAKQ